MREELLEQLQTWHEEDEYEKIVEAVTDIPEEERDYELISHLGRALNNLERYDEAIEQFLKIADEGQDDPLWHYRIGLAYYYLERYDEARTAFETADRLEPGDEDTLEVLSWIEEKTAASDTGDEEAAPASSASETVGRSQRNRLFLKGILMRKASGTMTILRQRSTSRRRLQMRWSSQWRSRWCSGCRLFT